ncbi:MAG: S46 family peptidase [Bacteroidales bacterium]|nr:S46 family peptidase [Bacteroidales bacterium]
MKKLISLIAILTITIMQVSAGEGMWILSLIGKNYDQMKAAGFRLSVEDIYSLNQACLKDAVVALNDGECTAEFVSSKGMLLTNYHCGYDDIQSQSSVLHDYLTDGFWAKTLKDELPIKGKTASLLVSIEDVTSKILSPETLRLSPEAQAAVIEGVIETMEEDNSQDGKYKVEVTNFFDGNSYYMFKYIVFKDVRLVGAPPESIGQFGGETDNYMWPRHTGDFCIFRVYTAPDGSPAEYADNNVPYVPKKHLKINAKGVNENDFAMIIGYPAETMRHYSSWDMAQTRDNYYAVLVDVFGKRLNALKGFIDSDDTIRIKYSAKYANDCNAYKCFLGANQALKDLDEINHRANDEARLSRWIADNKRTDYKNVLKQLKKDFATCESKNLYLNYWSFAIYSGCEFINFAIQHYALQHYLEMGFFKQANKLIDELRTTSEDYFRDYSSKVDLAISKQMIRYYMSKVPAKYTVKHASDSAYFAVLDDCFNHSILTDKSRYDKFLDNPSAEMLSNDMLFAIAIEWLDVMFNLQTSDSFDSKMDFHKRQYTKAMLDMVTTSNPDTLLYPDANSTMRLTYGNVLGYTANGKDMGWYTVIDSLIAKKKDNDREFYVSPRLQQLFDNRDFGSYAQDGTLRLCFLTDNDITGGNSGSGVLNGDGELVGLAFDGNWEAMACDFVFVPSLQRTICVDIRFVLFIIDKYAGAKNIIDEMDII